MCYYHATVVVLWILGLMHTNEGKDVYDHCTIILMSLAKLVLLLYH